MKSPPLPSLATLTSRAPPAFGAPMKRIFASALLFLGCATSQSAAPVSPPQAAAEVAPTPAPTLRLGNVATPIRYALRLAVDPNAEIFKGHIEIELELAQPTRTVWLNGTELTVHKASLQTPTGA